MSGIQYIRAMLLSKTREETRCGSRILLASGRPQQKDPEFKANLGYYRARSYLTIP